MFILIISVMAVLLLLLLLPWINVFLKKQQRQDNKAEDELVVERRKNQVLTDELTQLTQQRLQENMVDPLTGLPSRQILEDRLSQTLTQSKRFQMMFAVLFIDLDDFQMVNDVFGHDLGDDLLKTIAKRLELCVRQIDTLSRFSGDLFVLVLPQISKSETVIYIAKRLLEAISQPIRVQNQDLFITASIGIAFYPSDGDDVKTLLKNADTAMNQVKANGHGSYQFYHQGMHVLSRRELILNSSLRDPSVFQDFTLRYWPQMRVDSNEIIGVEAILNWQHRDFGLVQGRDLSRLIEKSGKMVELSEWFFREALTQFQLCRQRSPAMQNIFMSVSLLQLESSHLIHKLSQIFTELAFDPKHLILGISEDALTTKTEQWIKSINMVKHMGISVAIARFGTGQMSLQHLQKIPMDYLKVDESLISQLKDRHETEALLKMIVSVAKSVNATIISEGVVDEAQKSILKELGCEIMQGPLWGPICTGPELLQKIGEPQKSITS